GCTIPAIGPRPDTAAHRREGATLMLDLSIGGAALAGLLSFFSPCILPMVPFYLAYMAGTSVTELREDGALPPGVQGQLLLRAAAFALGVTTIFVLLGFG